MNGAPRIAPVPISSPAACPDRIATSGRRVSGSAVPTAASTDPTAPSDRPNPSPIHSTPFVNSSAPLRITTKETRSDRRAIAAHCPSGGSGWREARALVRHTGSGGPARGRAMIGSPAMSGSRPDASDVRPARARVSIALAVAITLPAVGSSSSTPISHTPLEALIFGLAIVGAAFLLSWAAEVAQLDISAGLAIAILALIAVLPEYAVDFVFAWKGGQSFAATGAACLPLDGGTESPCSLALANMTGANRLLIGIGWTMVVFIALYRLRKTGQAPPRRAAAGTGVVLDREHSIEIAFLAVATSTRSRCR